MGSECKIMGKALSLIRNGKKNGDRDKSIGLWSNTPKVSCMTTMVRVPISVLVCTRCLAKSKNGVRIRF